MTFHKGHKKLGGRVRGTPNKPRLEFWAKLNEDGWDITGDLKKALSKCDPQTQARVLLDMHKFIYPMAKDGEVDPAQLSDQEVLEQLKEATQLLEAQVKDVASE